MMFYCLCLHPNHLYADTLGGLLLADPRKGRASLDAAEGEASKT